MFFCRKLLLRQSLSCCLVCIKSAEPNGLDSIPLKFCFFSFICWCIIIMWPSTLAAVSKQLTSVGHLRQRYLSSSQETTLELVSCQSHARWHFHIRKTIWALSFIETQMCPKGEVFLLSLSLRGCLTVKGFKDTAAFMHIYGRMPAVLCVWCVCV